MYVGPVGKGFWDSVNLGRNANPFLSPPHKDGGGAVRGSVEADLRVCWVLEGGSLASTSDGEEGIMGWRDRKREMRRFWRHLHRRGCSTRFSRLLRRHGRRRGDWKRYPTPPLPPNTPPFENPFSSYNAQARCKTRASGWSGFTRFNRRDDVYTLPNPPPK